MGVLDLLQNTECVKIIAAYSGCVSFDDTTHVLNLIAANSGCVSFDGTNIGCVRFEGIKH